MLAMTTRILARFTTAQTVNYYKLFNIPPNFTEQQLKTSYLQLVKLHHPDLSKDPQSAEIFRQIQQGYAILSNAADRNKYQAAQKQSEGNVGDGDSDAEGIIKQLREKYYRDFSRKDPINDQFNFSYKLFKQHYEKVEQPKAEYQKYEGQNQSYYARKDEQGEKPWKQVAAGSAAVLILLAAYYYTNR